MTRLIDCPSWIISLLALIGLLLVDFEEITLIRFITLVRQKWYILSSLLLLALTIFTLFVFDDVFDARSGLPVFFSVSYVTLLFSMVVVYAALIVWTILLYRYTKRLLSRTITADSIREAVDTMPVGVQYSGENGNLLLINRRMLELNALLLHRGTANADESWKLLKNGPPFGDAKLLKKTADTLIFQLDTGTIIRYIRRQAEGLTETTALDITEQYELNRELKARNSQLEKINRHLRRFSREVADVTRDEEILAAKTQIHNDLAKSLLAARAYIASDGSSMDREKLMALWKRNLDVLRNDTDPEEKTDDLTELKKAASAVGVTIEMTGDPLPSAKAAHNCIIDAIHESINNMVKHSDGRHLRVDLQDGTCTILSDGKPPKCPVQEKGGLKNLHEEVRQSGGTMSIEWQPALKLTITFAGGGEKDV